MKVRATSLHAGAVPCDPLVGERAMVSWPFVPGSPGHVKWPNALKTVEWPVKALAEVNFG